MPRMKGGELIAEFLIRERIEHVFGICGHGNVGMLDALYGARDKIRLISPRHEQTAGHMADAYFRVKHHPAATLTSCGPGSANLVMALANAYADSSAFLALTANVPTQQFNRGPFQELYRQKEADFPSVCRPVVKRTFQPTRVEMLPTSLRLAMDCMLGGRPGPVQVDIPFNLFVEEADVEVAASSHGRIARRSGAAPEDVAAAGGDAARGRAAGDLHRPRRRSFGGGRESLWRSPSVLRCPVIASPNGMGCIPMGHALSLGFIGRNGAYPANQAGRHARSRAGDRGAVRRPLGLLLDRRLFLEFSGVQAGARRSRRERDRAELSGRSRDRRRCAHVPAPASGRDRSDAALARPERGAWLGDDRRLAGRVGGIHAAQFRDRHDAAPARAGGRGRAEGAGGRRHHHASISGVHHNWFMQFWEARQPQTMLNAWGFSAMGFGVSGILGAKLAAPERPAVAICGDGGFTMTPHVLCTAVEYDIPCVWLIWNNFAWAAIRDIQYGLFEGRELGTAFRRGPNREPYNPDFAMMARAHGVEGATITRIGDLAPALEHAVASGKPWVLDVHVDAEVRPPATGTWALPPIPHKEPVFGHRSTAAELAAAG